MKRLFKVGAERHDPGKVTVSWHPDGNFLASAGKNGIVHITDRHGDIIDEIPMESRAPILALEWDKDGEYLAILQEGNGVVPLWNLSSKRVVPLETSLRDPTFLAWSKTGPQLAVGTAKGSLLIYNKSRKQKIPIVGKHSKRISCGAWSMGGNKLVLGSDDKTLTISNEVGDTLLHTELKHAPTQTQFTMNKNSAGGPGAGNTEDNMVSANLSGRSLLLYNIMDEREDPMELTFAPRENGSGCKYGDVVSHEWYDDGMLLVGFSGGYLLSVSTNSRDLGEEKHSCRYHKDSLTTFAYNPHSKRCATAGEDGVRIVDTRDFSELRGDFISTEDMEGGRVTHVCWSPDGQILTVGTSMGNVYNFLAKMSALCSRYQTNIGYLSSLREISVVDAARRGRPIDVTVKLEPSLIALGANHVAAGMNNRVYYHRISEDSGRPVNDQEYVGIVKEVQLNATFAAILTDSKAILHPIEPGPNTQEQTKTFPGREEGAYSRVSCMALTDDFLYYGTEAGTVEVFFLGEFKLLAGAELRLDHSIKKLYPNVNGTRVVVVDSANQVFLYNPVTGGGINQSITRFESAPHNIVSVIWDSVEKNVIMLFDGKCVHSFIYVHTSVKGSLLIKLGPVSVSSEGEVNLAPDKIELAGGNLPILSISGTLTCQTTSGNLSTIVHPYFDQLGEDKRRRNDDGGSQKRDKKFLSNKFCQALALLKLESAWEVALELDRRQFWLALSGKAMELLNIELARRVYRQLGDAGMVMALEECLHIEDKNLLAGQVSLLFSDYQRAQDLFLASSRPSAALDMRRDLLQWDQALKLAQVLSSEQIPDICVQYGQQLEFREESDAALKMFENALNAQDDLGNNVCPDALIPIAMAGVARCNLRLGNLRQGIRLANELDDKQLFIDCGDILESQKHYTEAASLFLRGKEYEKAATIYTKYLLKNDKNKISECAAIMEKVDNDGLNSAFAKACVAAGRFEDAVRAYERAKDVDKVVELKLKHLDQVQEAFDIVRKGASSQGAQTVADYCNENEDYRGAIEFLLIASKSDEAFKLAVSQGIMDVFTAQLGDNISTEDALRVASYYEKSQNYAFAGRFYSLCGQYSRALKYFIQCGDREIDAAIEVVGKSQTEALTHQLLDFLVGEKDGVPKDPNYIYRLYLALKKYEDAAKTALIIARQEQDLGNYPLAHSVVVETIRQLEDAGIRVSLQLRQAFVLLHSYIRVKSLIKFDEHVNAARLLMRVVQNVSKFPTSIVNILTSSVIVCQRAGLRTASFEYAVMLMRPEYRASFTDASLRKKIEAIVRRRVPEGETDPPEETSLCPISHQPIPVTQLECPTTRDALPMCVVSGKHMTLEDWCFCPVSRFPALYSEYVRYIENEIKAILALGAKDILSPDGKFIPASTASPSGGSASIGLKLSTMTAPDPVLGKPVAVSDLKISLPEEAMKYIQRYNNVVEKKEPEEGEEGGTGGASTKSSGVGGGGSSEKSAPDRDASASSPPKKSSSRSQRERAMRLKEKNRRANKS